MKPGVLVLVILFLAVGSLLGWHAQRAHSAHGDIKLTKKNRLPSFRKTRNRSGLWVLGIAVVLLLIMSALIRH
jgi:hypothetical protein